MSIAADFVNIENVYDDALILSGFARSGEYLKDIFGKGMETHKIKLSNGEEVTVAKIQMDLQRIQEETQQLVINGENQDKIKEDEAYQSFMVRLITQVGKEKILDVTELLGQRSTIALIQQITDEFTNKFSEIPMFEAKSIESQTVWLNVDSEQCQVIRQIWGKIYKAIEVSDDLPPPKALAAPVAFDAKAVFDLRSETKEYQIFLK